MKKANLSFPIDAKLQRALQAEVKRSGLSRAYIVRQILRKHFGLILGGEKAA